MVMAALELVSIPGMCCGAMFGWAERREFLAASQSTTASSGSYTEGSAVIAYGWPSLHAVREDAINLRPSSCGPRSTGIAAYFTDTPDWVCEGLSPSTRRLDLSEKRAIYAREGVRHLWFVDPDARTLEAFELRDEQWLLLATLAGDAPVSLPPFDAITFPLDALRLEVITGAEGADNGDG